MTHCLYVGRIRHRRFQPIQHEFSYPVYYYYLDLASLPDILTTKHKLFANRWWLPSWQRADYYQPITDDLISLVKQQVQHQLGFIPNGPVYQLTQLRLFNVCFNPLTLYYCFNKSDILQAVVADVGNIPWFERHTYVLDRRQATMKPEHDKAFHVSPLLPMDMRYQWVISEPREKLTVHINDSKAGEKWFDASLNLSARDLTRANLRPILWRHPLQTYGIVWRIYWQALKLRLKGATYYPYKRKESDKK